MGRRNVFRVLVETAEGKISVGRPRCRWGMMLKLVLKR
jgi:hypothetical protein